MSIIFVFRNVPTSYCYTNLLGDRVKAKSCQIQGRFFEGMVVNMDQHELIIKFGDDFRRTFDHSNYKVCFGFNRTPFVRMHNAIDMAAEMLEETKLFPTKLVLSKRLQLNVTLNIDVNMVNGETNRPLIWFNHKLNKIQKIAVNKVLRADCIALPYIIYGPPGSFND